LNATASRIVLPTDAPGGWSLAGKFTALSWADLQVLTDNNQGSVRSGARRQEQTSGSSLRLETQRKKPHGPSADGDNRTEVPSHESENKDVTDMETAAAGARAGSRSDVAHLLLPPTQNGSSE